MLSESRTNSHITHFADETNPEQSNLSFEDWMGFNAQISSGLYSPGFPQLAQYLLNAEAATAHPDTQRKRSVTNETFANMPIDDLFAGDGNDFAIFTRLCYDNSFVRIDTQATFV